MRLRSPRAAQSNGLHGLVDELRWSVSEFCLEAIRHRPFLEPELAIFGAGECWNYAHSTILKIAVEMGTENRRIYHAGR